MTTKAIELPIDPAECNLEVERISPVHVRLKARVPASLVRRFRKKLKRLGAEAELSEVKSELIRFLATQAAEREQFKIAGTILHPEGSPEPRLSLDHDFVVMLEVDTVPVLEEPDMSAVELLQPDAPVTKEMIDAELTRQCIQAGERTDGDSIRRPCEAVARIELRLAPGEPAIWKDERHSLLLLPDDDAVRALGVILAGVAPSLEGVRLGEEKVIATRLPTDMPLRWLRGAAAELRITPTTIKHIAAAPLAEVLKQYGSTEQRLRTQIQYALEQQRLRNLQATLRSQAAAKLSTLIPVEVPPGRMRLQLSRAKGELFGLLKARGQSEAQCQSAWEAQRAGAEAAAANHARTSVLLMGIPRDSGLLNEQIVTNRIAALAAERGLSPEALRASLVKSGKFEEFIGDTAAEAILDSLVRKAKVKSVPMEEWKAAMEAARV